MTNRLAIALALCVVPMAAAEAGSYETGTSLKAKCDESDASIQKMACTSYIAATADAMDDGNSLDGFRACIPVKITQGQLMAVIQRSLSRHPEKLHLSASGLVAKALAEAFSCGK
jgi:hypothetical protein